MDKFSAIASHGYPPPLVLYPEQGIGRSLKETQPFLPNPELRPEVMRSGSHDMGPHHNEKKWRLNGDLLFRIDSALKTLALIDVQDNCPNSTLFSFGIAKQCTRHEKILKFLMSGSGEVEKDGVDFSTLSELMGLLAVDVDCTQQWYPSDLQHHKSQLIYPSINFDSPKPLFDFAGEFVHRPEIMVCSEGRVSMTGNGPEMEDVLSILAECYVSRNLTKGSNNSFLVPHFDRRRLKWRCGSSLGPETVTVVPLKSADAIKLKPSTKKKSNRKTAKERDLSRSNYFQACETLLSIVVDKQRDVNSAIPTLKKSGPELPLLLNQFSASIAGTGLALLFSVVCKLASGPVPFCSSKALNTGLGLALVWLSWAVNKLTDTIVSIRKGSGRCGLKEEEMLERLDSSVKEIYFRAAALVAVVVLRLA